MSTVASVLPTVARTGLLARTNAVVKLLGALVITAVLVVSADPVTSGVALGGQLLLLAAAGIGPWRLLTTLWPIVVAALISGWGTAVLSPEGGPVLLHLGWITITTGSLAAGGAIALRGLAIALPGITVLLTTDPTDLADGLAQTLKLPARFVLAALAALRLVEVMVTEWGVLAAARRARGAGGARGPWAALTEFAGLAFTLLVQSLRRATRLAMTMEARGFGAGPRTWARVPRFGRVDVVVGCATVLIAVAAVTLSLLTGAHRFIWQ
ncbi:cobalt transporter [Kocuria marina]|mgnify:CR=1 FL=1|uniref:Cobalt transporter n=2 Tax=Kocuria TaxID=57493 RepID=A0A0B0D8J3_9MICC|nr:MULTISPECIES: energy-coupling factor transporter transmembrane component T [Kocuria]KHE74296.1 cobalt transporter [Kocuria marina]